MSIIIGSLIIWFMFSAIFYLVGRILCHFGFDLGYNLVALSGLNSKWLFKNMQDKKVVEVVEVVD